jgi:hypothetical protein
VHIEERYWPLFGHNRQQYGEFERQREIPSTTSRAQGKLGRKMQILLFSHGWQGQIFF